MTDILSESFYGNKILKQPHYKQLHSSIKVDLLRELFSTSINNLAKGNSELE